MIQRQPFFSDIIVERMNCSHYGSCTEPLISHTLSECLSKNPLAWSKEGLGKMAMLRIFEENGGKITSEHIRISRDKSKRRKDFNVLRNGLEIYNKYAEEQVKSVFAANTIGAYLTETKPLLLSLAASSQEPPSS